MSTIQGRYMELVFTTIALFIVILAASYIFHQRIKMAQTEYEESKSTVRNITIGFTRQAKKMETDLDRIERGKQRQIHGRPGTEGHPGRQRRQT